LTMLITSPYVPSGTFHPKRYRPGGFGNWSGHLPFANDLIQAVRPELLVELGTHYGESYFGFCQAVSEHNVPCACYAVDTWTGEDHAGYYGEEVYAEVESYNRANYDKFSYLLRTTFDAALSQFSSDSIDVLHIDGLHTYEAVSRDFYGWLPKVKPGGIVLLHDIKTRHGGFGVWKLWEELKSQGETFEFEHSWGLGVFRKPGLATPAEGLPGILFGDSDEMKAHLRRFYVLCATELEYRHQANDRHRNGAARLQVFLPSAEGYREENSHSVDLAVGEWQRIDIELITGLKGALRLDLTDRPAVIDVAGLTLRSPVNDDVLWTARGYEFRSFALNGTIVRLEVNESGNICRFFSFGADPQLILPDLSSPVFDQPLRLQIWLRIRSEFSELVPLFRTNGNGSPDVIESANDVIEGAESKLAEDLTALKVELARVESERDALLARWKESEGWPPATPGDYDRIRQERESLAAENEELLTEHGKARTQVFLLKSEAKQARKELETLRAELMQVRVSYDACRTQRLELENLVRSLRDELAQLATCRSMQVTAPMRAVSRLFKKG
jgi:Chromosome segregation ATPases